jgi:hypothetical protein
MPPYLVPVPSTFAFISSACESCIENKKGQEFNTGDYRSCLVKKQLTMGININASGHATYEAHTFHYKITLGKTVNQVEENDVFGVLRNISIPVLLDHAFTSV